jgi:hypothetical protein
VNGAVIANDTAAPWTTTWTAGAAGNYTLTARAYDNAGAATTSAPLAISVTAPANQPPTVSVSSPAANATFTTGATVTISANAADADGTVARVEFLVNGAVIANDTAAPWTTTWTAGAAGNYTLTARAYDNAGAATTSAPVSITVTAAANQPPTIRITQPASSITVGVPSTLTIVASVADPDGTVTRVEFLVNGTIVGNVTAAPWQTVHTISSPGTYTLTARAYDNAGAATTSASVIVKANRGGR